MRDDQIVRLPGRTGIRRSQVLPAVAACAVVAACGGTTFSHAAEVQPASVEVVDLSRPQSSVIRQDEMRARSVQTAYEAVMRLRPHFLAAGHMDTLLHTMARPAAVVDNGVPESINALKEIPADVVLDIRFIEPRDAVTLFGARYSGGIVIVRLTDPRKIPDLPISDEIETAPSKAAVLRKQPGLTAANRRMTALEFSVSPVVATPLHVRAHRVIQAVANVNDRTSKAHSRSQSITSVGLRGVSGTKRR